MDKCRSEACERIRDRAGRDAARRYPCLDYTGDGSIASSTVISATARNNVPAISVVTQFAKDGGLMSYATSIMDQFRSAAGYVDRILRGEKPTDLPVQMPTKFQTIVNLKTAKALGLSISPGLLASTNEVIE